MDETRKCPFCGKQVRVNAPACPFCAADPRERRRKRYRVSGSDVLGFIIVASIVIGLRSLLPESVRLRYEWVFGGDRQTSWLEILVLAFLLACPGLIWLYDFLLGLLADWVRPKVLGEKTPVSHTHERGRTSERKAYAAIRDAITELSICISDQSMFHRMVSVSTGSTDTNREFYEALKAKFVAALEQHIGSAAVLAKDEAFAVEARRLLDLSRALIELADPMRPDMSASSSEDQKANEALHLIDRHSAACRAWLSCATGLLARIDMKLRQSHAPTHPTSTPPTVGHNDHAHSRNETMEKSHGHT